jgi:hypothetical protein
MPMLRSGKVWQVICHFVYYFFNLGTPKTVISKIATTRQIGTPCSSPYDYRQCSRGTKKLVHKKKLEDKNVLIPF